MKQIIKSSSSLSRLNTDLVPLNRIAPNVLSERIVPRSVFLDSCDFLTDFGTPTIPISETPEPASTALRTMQPGFAYGPCHYASIKKARQELLNVNTTALQSFICFTQGASLSIGATPIVNSDVIVSAPSENLTLQPKSNGENLKEDRPAFYEPITFEWTKKGNQIRQVAQRYSENTHADY